VSPLTLISRRLSRPALRFLIVLAFTVAGLSANAAAAYAVGAPTFSALPGGGPGGQIASSFWITATSNPNNNTGGNNIDCYQSLNGGSWGNIGGSVSANGSWVTDSWQVTQAGLHQIYCTAKGANGSTAQTGSPSSPALSFVYDPTTPSVGAGLSGGWGDNGWYASAPSVYEYDGGDSTPWGYIYSRWCSPSYNQGYNTETCYAETAAGKVGAGSTGLYYDSVAPSVSTAISGGSAQNGWYSSAPSISPSAWDGTSGVWYDSCTQLANGVNYVTCSATDVAGNGATDAATQVNLDTQTPATAVPSSTGVWYSSRSAIPSLAVSASEATDYSGLTSLSCANPNSGAAGSYSLTQGVGASSSLQGTYPATDVTPGTNTVTCTNTTGAGNTAASSFDVLYDPQTPTVQITTTADATRWYRSIASIPQVSVSGTLGASGIASFACSADGIAPQTYSSATGGTVNLAGLHQGSGTITCTLLANNGLSATTTQTLKLDTTTPTVAYSTTASRSLWYTNTNLPEVDVNGATTGASGVDHLTCNGDGLPTDYTITGASGTIPAADLDQGAGQISCASTSGAGISSSAATLGVQIDDTVPTVTLNSSLDSAAWYPSAFAIPAVNVASTSGPSGIASITCQAPDAPNTLTTATGTLDLSTLRDGSDTITCTPMSPAGVDGSPATLLVQLDSQTPTLTFAGRASQTKWYDSVGSIPELDTDATTGASGLASIDCSGDGIATQSAAASGTAVALSGLQQGTGAVTCTATSLSGLTSRPQAFTLNLDGGAPSAAWSTSESETTWYPSTASVPALTLDAAAGGPSGVDHITCTGDGFSSNVTISATSGTLHPTGFGDGANTITCVPYSGAGVSGAAIARTILVDSTRPAVALSGTDSSTWYPAAQTVSADASADTDPSGVESISCAVDGGGPTVTNDAHASQAVSGDGVHAVSCHALSGAGASGADANTTVRIDTQAPAVTQTVIPAGPSDPAGSVEVVVTAAETHPLSGIASTSCSLDHQPATVVQGSKQTIGVTSAGLHSLVCSATTNAGVAGSDSTQTYTVNADPSQFSLQYGTVPTAWQAATVTVPVALTGATANAYSSLTCTVDGGSPTSIAGTSGSVDVTASGSQQLACYATAANGADTAAQTQTVKIDKQTPTAGWSTSATPGGEQVTLLGSEPTLLSGIAAESCSVDGGPAQRSSTPHLAVAVNGNGSHTLDCTITSGAGVTAHVTHAATVTVPVPAPIAVATPDPTRWYAAAQSVVLGIPTGGPAVTAVRCTQGGAATSYPVSGANVTVPVPAPGGDVRCVDLDATGQQSTTVDFPVHIDTGAPTGYFTQTGPRTAVAAVSNPGTSGIQTVTVQYQVGSGAWVTIPGAYDPAGSEISVALPAALQQPGVQYALRLLAVNNAGGRSTIATMKDGTPATGSAPASPANPFAGAAVRGGLYVGTVPPGGRVRVARMVPQTRKVHVKRGGKTVVRIQPLYRLVAKRVTVHGRTTVRQVKVPVLRRTYVWQINTAALAPTLTVSYGQTVGLAGTLTLAAGQVSGQTVTIVQQGNHRRLTATTTAGGSFTATLGAGGTRTVTYTLAGVSHTVTIRVRGQVAATVRGAAPRRTLTVAAAGATGRVAYQLQQNWGGRWPTVGPTRRTDRLGHAAVPLPAAVASTPPSRLRVVVSTQPAWPYLNVKEDA
jgi:hypothetical protein